MKRLRSVTAFAALCVVVAVSYVGLTTFEVWRVGHNHNNEAVDAIVVMGAAQYDGRPSPLLRARLDHAFELWSEGQSQLIVVTGGNQPGDRFTEASASITYLTEKGVPPKSLLAEDSSRSTYEAMSNVRELVNTSASFGGLEKIVIVTDPFHSLRSRLTAEELGFEASTSASHHSPLAGRRAAERHLKEGLGIALGRIIGFKNLWKITG